MHTVIYDAIVVGSGPSGVIAAQTLLDAGLNVLLLDGGNEPATPTTSDSTKSFTELRRSDLDQWSYLLGPRFESLGLDTVTVGAQLTPSRRFITKDVSRLIPLVGDDFRPLESLASGGLGQGWGLGSCVFDGEELSAASLPVAEMNDAYQRVTDKIGISGEDDDARPYTYRHLHGVQPALPLNPTAEAVYHAYQRKRRRLHREGFRMGRPTLALLSKPHDGRPAASMREMEFYEDDGSAWRPHLLLHQLSDSPNFTHRKGFLVLAFSDGPEYASVTSLELSSHQRITFHCRRLILAAGALGSARIALRSFPDVSARTPLLCNAYSYVPVIVPRRLGAATPPSGMALSQLALFLDESAPGAPDIGMAFFYSYRSLMLFRLLREAPINAHDARILLQYLMPALLVVGIHHPEKFSPDKFLRLESDSTSPTDDRLFVSYKPMEDEKARVKQRNRKYVKALRAMGAWPIKVIEMPAGASIHYAGTLPYSRDEIPFTVATNGRLHGTRRVFVADGSGFTYLPAKGLTLSLMANAYRVASALARGPA